MLRKIVVGLVAVASATAVWGQSSAVNTGTGTVHPGMRVQKMEFHRGRPGAPNAAAAARIAAFKKLTRAQRLQLLAADLKGRKTAAAKLAPKPKSGSLSELYAYETSTGSQPFGNLIQATDGNFYGTTTVGGSCSTDGVLYKLTPSGSYSVLHNFTGDCDGVDGALPYAAPTEGPDGYLYGTTTIDGQNDSGTIYRIKLDGSSYSIQYRFSNIDTPVAPLTPDGQGLFLGTTFEGGAYGAGNWFSFDPSSGTYTDIYDFTGGEDGANPEGGVTIDQYGLIWGAARYGGCSDDGGTGYGDGTTAVYDYYGDLGGGYVGAVCWDGAYGGFGPANDAVVAADTDVYGGLESYGESNFSGGFWFADIADNNFYQVYFDDFGMYPFLGSFYPTAGNKLYFSSSFGGTNNDGYTGYIDVSDSADLAWGGEQIANFPVTGTDGIIPSGQPFLSSTGTLVGTTSYDGAQNEGNGVAWDITGEDTAQISLTSNHSSVTQGSPVTLTYSVLNAFGISSAYCFGTSSDGSWSTGGQVGMFSGTATVTPAAVGTTTYSFNCGGTESATVSVTVNSSLPTITFTSVTHNMGSVAVGSSTTGTSNYGVQVKNNSSSTVTFTGVTITGSNEFSQTNGCGTSLAAGKTCEIVFVFKPTATGTVTATWKLAGTSSGVTFGPSNGGTLTGTGVAAGNLTITTNGHNFGATAINGTSPTFGAVVTNSTGSAVTLSVGTTTAPFHVVLNNCPATLAANASCNLQWNFQPTTSGAVKEYVPLSASQTIYFGTTPVTSMYLAGTGNQPAAQPVK